jgi:hypothetical protein
MIPASFRFHMLRIPSRIAEGWRPAALTIRSRSTVHTVSRPLGDAKNLFKSTSTAGQVLNSPKLQAICMSNWLERKQPAGRKSRPMSAEDRFNEGSRYGARGLQSAGPNVEDRSLVGSGRRG